MQHLLIQTELRWNGKGGGKAAREKGLEANSKRNHVMLAFGGNVTEEQRNEWLAFVVKESENGSACYPNETDGDNPWPIEYSVKATSDVNSQDDFQAWHQANLNAVVKSGLNEKAINAIDSVLGDKPVDEMTADEIVALGKRLEALQAKK